MEPNFPSRDGEGVRFCRGGYFLRFLSTVRFRSTIWGLLSSRHFQQFDWGSRHPRTSRSEKMGTTSAQKYKGHLVWGCSCLWRRSAKLGGGSGKRWQLFSRFEIRRSPENCTTEGVDPSRKVFIPIVNCDSVKDDLIICDSHSVLLSSLCYCHACHTKLAKENKNRQTDSPHKNW